MRKVAFLALALSLGACASGQTLKTQHGRNPSYGDYGAATYSYGRTAQPRYTPPEVARGEVSASLEAEVLAEINRVRTHPEWYAERLRAFRVFYHGGVVRVPGDEVGVRTHEGVAALDEAIADVERRRPLQPLVLDRHLRASAATLAREEGPTGVVGHVGPDGLTPGQRMHDAGVWAGISEENISFGQANAAAVVRQLIIDDGVPDRGHRSSIFEPGLTAAGVSCGPHVVYGWMCVIDVAGALARG